MRLKVVAMCLSPFLPISSLEVVGMMPNRTSKAIHLLNIKSHAALEAYRSSQLTLSRNALPDNRPRFHSPSSACTVRERRAQGCCRYGTNFTPSWWVWRHLTMIGWLANAVLP